MKTFETLTEALNDLRKRGYLHDFNLHPEWIECPPLNLRLKPSDFHVDEVHRFEGMTSPDDSSILFAVATPEGIKGTLLDAYGVYSETLNPQMLEHLLIDRHTNQHA